MGRRDECPHCRADLHTCLNCTFYAPEAPQQCREPIAELVRDKERTNFCDLFRPQAGARTAASDAAAARARLESLFEK